VTDLIKTLIDIYGKVGDFHITPCDGAIPISEADRLAQEAVEQHNIAVAKAEVNAITTWLRKHGMRQVATSIEEGKYK
jgi:hypothetical protein